MNLLEVDRLAIGQGHLALIIHRVSEKVSRVTVLTNTTGYRLIINDSVAPMLIEQCFAALFC